MLTRRDALKTVLAGVGTAAAVRINPEFFVNSAYAQAGKPMRFLAAEALTGNWDRSPPATPWSGHFQRSRHP